MEINRGDIVRYGKDIGTVTGPDREFVPPTSPTVFVHFKKTDLVARIDIKDLTLVRRGET
jgi:hypothetical protein